MQMFLWNLHVDGLVLVCVSNNNTGVLGFLRVSITYSLSMM